MTSLKKEIRDWTGIILGCMLSAAGFVFFINPYDIVPGGVYGASIVLHNIFPHIQVGTFGYMFDIPLLILAAWLLGAKLGAKTLTAALITPLMMNSLSSLCYPTKEALYSLDPSMLLGGAIDLSDQLILPVIIGSVMIGVSSGIIVRCGATTGGTDIVGMLMQKFLKIRFSKAILFVDGAVVLFGLIVLALKTGGSSIYLSLYSLISIYLISRVVARTLNGSHDDKLFFIISEKPLEQLHDYILNDLDRTATKIKSSGLYTGREKEMIFLVVSYKEVHEVKQIVKEADPSAFVVVTDAYDTYGEGWKVLPDRGEIQPE